MIQNLKLTILLLCFFTGVGFAAAQSQSEFKKPKEAARKHADKVIITTQDEADYFIKNYASFWAMGILKIQGDVDANRVLAVAGRLNELFEVQLQEYRQPLLSSTFDSLFRIEKLTLKINEDNANLLQGVSRMATIRELVLLQNFKTDTFTYLAAVKNLQKITILGEFLPYQVGAIFNEVRHFKNLTDFGISLDYMTDLHPAFFNLTNIKRIAVYDNLSRLSNQSIDNLLPQRFKLVGNPDIYNHSLLLVFYSDNISLTIFEMQHLKAMCDGTVEFNASELPENIAPSIVKIEASDVLAKPFKPEFHINLGLHPIVPHVILNEEYFEINPAKNNIISTKNGTIFSIPANTFAEQDGTLPVENIYIRYRNMADAMDILFAGPNMHTGSNNNSPIYHSNGMFEFYASSKKGELTIGSGKHIKAEVIATPDSLGRSFLYDESSREWMDYELYSTVMFQETMEVQKFHEWTEANTDRYYHFDSRNFEERYKDKHSYFILDKESSKTNIGRHSNYWVSLAHDWVSTKTNTSKQPQGQPVKSGKPLIKIQKSYPKNPVNGKIFFQILDKSNFVLFPELKALSKLMFMYNGDLEKKLFSYQVSSGKFYDVRVLYEGGNKVVVELKGENGFVRLDASPGNPENKKEFEKELAKFKKQYAAYKNLLKKREDAFNEALSLRKKAYINYYNLRNTELVKKNYVHTIRMREMGVYGVLKEFKTVNSPIDLIITYTDMQGLPIDVKEVFVIEKNCNSFRRINTGNASLDVENTLLLLCTDYRNNVYYIDKQTISGLGLKTNMFTYFPMNLVAHPLRTASEYKNYTGFYKLK